MRATAEATRRRAPEGAAEAVKVFHSDLDRKQQLQLANEIAETRGAELCRAYPNVIDVGAGFRTRRDKAGTPRKRKDAAVVFYVSRKWAEERGSKPEDAIPRHLYTYVNVKRRRKLCAVPTDVADANDEGAAKVQANTRRVRVQPAPLPHPGIGTLTCLIRRSTLPRRVFAISCRHVLSLSADHHGRRFAIWPVGDAADDRPLGKTRNVLGELCNGPEPSLDAQLCEVTAERAVLRRVFGGLTLSGAVTSPDDLPERAVILTSHGRVKARGLRIAHRSLPYSHPSLKEVVHRKLIVTEFVGAGTERGDSGAALVTLGEKPLLVGMHIAASENGRFSYAIPAAHFLDPRLYKKGTVGSEKWTLVAP
ncbi:hypothetical protein AAFN88_11650 [Pelagibius sp. CAU 1746]|uniref:hypothetical protein n=1 Tax=Pelagibius sp. CAU 1746 TaxID=3140370 RepID=UPI00325A65B3